MITELNKVYIGDALTLAKQLPDNFVDCIICSPPYWGLRNYETDSLIWDGNENCNHSFDDKIEIKRSGGKRSLQDANQGSWFENQSYFCSKCGAWKGSLGLEPTFKLLIKHLCDIFANLKRTLKNPEPAWKAC